jgi:CheY-like chemotaxis protein
MMRALVIDDDANVGAAIQVILSRHKFETVLAARAHAGLRALEESEFDVVIVDVFLPGMSGLDTIRTIRQKEPWMPIVAMTGFSLRASQEPDGDFLKLAVQRGATSSVRKPFAPQQLLQAIHTSLAKARVGSELS